MANGSNTALVKVANRHDLVGTVPILLPSPDVPPAVAGMPVLSRSGSRAGHECAYAPTQHGPGE